MKWLKMGCGHLVALPLLLVGLLTAVLFSVTLSGTGLVHRNDLLVTGGITLITWGLAISLLAYLWLRVWPSLRPTPSGTDPAPNPDRPSSPERSSAPGSFYVRAQSALANLNASSAPPPTEAASGPTYLPDDERPWEVRDVWSDAQITSDRGAHEESTGSVGMLLFGFLFAAIGGGLMWIILSDPDPSYAWIFALAFVLAGLGVMGKGLYQILRKRRYGTTTFEMDTFPGALGGPLCGLLHTGVRAAEAPPDGVHVMLSCYHRRITRDSDGDRSIVRTLLWRNEKRIEGRPADDGDTLDVPLAFEVPADLPPSTARKTETRILWAIEATARTRGIDYATVVEIPVFPVRPDTSINPDRYTRHEIEYDRKGTVSRGIALYRPSSAELSVVFGRARRPGVATLLTFLGVSMTAGGVLLMSTSIFGGIFLLLFGGLVDYGAYYYWTHRSRVTVAREGIQVETGVAGFATTTQFPCRALHEIRFDVVSNGEYVMILSHTTDGSPPIPLPETDAAEPAPQHEVTAARLITNLPEAKWIAAQIEEAAARHARYD